MNSKVKSTKLGICILAHHKPWLIMSSLVSLAMQTDNDFDIHIIYIKGNGENRSKESYQEFYEISDKINEHNIHLSEDDNRILNIVNKTNYQITYHEFSNDHGLDTGAWYKFIQKGVWKGYNHSFFLMEGFVFTSSHVLASIKALIKNQKIDFISSGHEKRTMSRALLENLFTMPGKTYGMNLYHQKIINKIFRRFCQDKKFSKLYREWNKDSVSATFYCTPSSVYSFVDKLRFFLINLLKRKVICNPTGKFVLENPNRKCHSYKKIGECHTLINGVNFHVENSPYYYGCSCQHLFSNRFLKSMDDKYKEGDFWGVADLPFSATPLEPLWGMLPAWLGYKKWFFDGIHRPRKNFITYKREDDVEGMCHYLNIYYKGKLIVEPNGDFIRIKWLAKDYQYLRSLLGSDFFT